jgi:cardiolipin synthase
MLFSVRNLPNLLSVSRILMGPAFLLLFRLPAPWGPAACGLVMAASGATDLLDGSLARRNKTVSLLGKWLDPLSDFAFFLFVYLTFWLAGLMPLAYFVLFLSREFLMYAVIRPLSMVRHLDPAAKLPGKLKTIAQSAASGLVLALLLAVHLGWLPALGGLQPAGLLPAASWWIMAVPVALSVGSLYWYIRPLVSAAAPGGLPGIPGYRTAAAAAARYAGAGRRYLAANRIIAVSVLIYFLLQSAFMIGVTWLYRLDWRLAGLFLGIGAVFHILFLLGLLLVRGEFNLEPSGELLRSLNLPLILSFLRFSSVPTGLYLLLAVRIHPELRLLLIVFLGLIFLTDLLDSVRAPAAPDHAHRPHPGRLGGLPADRRAVRRIHLQPLDTGLVPGAGAGAPGRPVHRHRGAVYPARLFGAAAILPGQGLDLRGVLPLWPGAAGVPGRSGPGPPHPAAGAGIPGRSDPAGLPHREGGLPGAGLAAGEGARLLKPYGSSTICRPPSFCRRRE